MKLLKYLSVVLLLSSASCVRTNVVSGVPVRFERPLRVFALEADRHFAPGDLSLMSYSDLQIVSDSIIVFQSRANFGDSCFFCAYSLPSFHHLGSFVHNGRGPGEMLLPQIAKVCSDYDHLFVNDNQLRQGYSIDVRRSIETNHSIIAINYTLPLGTIYWLPLNEKEQFTFNLQEGHLIFHSSRLDGTHLGTMDPFEYSGKESHLSQFGGYFTIKNRSRVVAECMVCFPQINFYDTQTGRIHSVAVDKAYRKWEHILNSWTSMDSIMNSKQYYAGVTSSSDYIFATYLDCSVSRSMEEGHGASIHVFDWDGHFLADLHVREDIGPIAYDPISGHLYGIDTVKDQLIRYTVELP